MYEAQISFLLVGSDDGRWVGYAFDDTYFNDDKNSVHKDEDPIASDGKPTANLPIMNARVYFLKIFHIRSAKAFREWERLVWMVKHNIDTHVRWNSSRLIINSESLKNTKTREPYTRPLYYKTPEEKENEPKIAKTLSTGPSRP